ncbi:MAG: alanine racemase [Planctomycetales bacterium]|nr:alanine racemase [Planctomycetales bacterium]
MSVRPATPFLLVDGLVVRRNLQRLAEYADEFELAVRPHTKTHKSEILAKLQVEAGAYGLTVAKIGEAEVMSHVTDDLLLAYPVVDAEQAKRLAKLAAHNTVRVAVDSRFAIETLAAAARSASTTMGVLIDIDVGLHRTGVQTVGQSLVLAELVDRTAGLRLDGLFCYPGHVWVMPEAQGPLLGEVSDLLYETLGHWAEHGIEAAIVSGGSTPTCFQSHLVPELNEIRPGTYIFNDVNTWRGGFCRLEDCAARVVATVVSTAVPGQVVIDAGTKTLAADACVALPQSGHGYLPSFPEARIVKLSEEHGQLDVRECRHAPQLGERVEIIPNHICPCMNLQDRFWWKEEDGRIEPLPVDARGKVT